jgi:hypothetical protein
MKILPNAPKKSCKMFFLISCNNIAFLDMKVYKVNVALLSSIRGTIKPGQRLVEMRIIFSIMSLLGKLIKFFKIQAGKYFSLSSVFLFQRQLVLTFLTAQCALAGLTWIFGLIQVSSPHIVLEYFFAITNTLQVRLFT